MQEEEEKNFPIKDQVDLTDFYISQLQKVKTYKSESIEELEDLEEFKTVDQKEIKKGIKRRWFQNRKYTLIVWYDLEDEIVGFQLCYGKNGEDKAISWYNDKEFSHRKVDYGNSSDLSPVLNEDFGSPEKAIFDDFYKYGKKLIWR